MDGELQIHDTPTRCPSLHPTSETKPAPQCKLMFGHDGRHICEHLSWPGSTAPRGPVVKWNPLPEPKYSDNDPLAAELKRAFREGDWLSPCGNQIRPLEIKRSHEEPVRPKQPDLRAWMVDCASAWGKVKANSDDISCICEQFGLEVVAEIARRLQDQAHYLYLSRDPEDRVRAGVLQDYAILLEGTTEEGD